ncbi:MarR family transcriptional regulator [Parvibaculum sp.]|jgi:DNA-binding MarR family transcriptional regulator|uniref:MarR family winged helix-turn-helix transcriptional regulator n=1 Tax=Parvibaculum sp. TaxID=2024848 RepID=UPI000C362A7C|nr:MarR family transcriptional regulator [Parvibaculum sp.]MAU62165.1 MarR family transcriptional regulator [Parvibaculum sp.]MBO6667056.1 MarR family transcriptional regulator [Parvibaculum sp.]MBO6690500.1 MarR family transcriptional regulator [Parvibaculum sp.]MBO6716124.1 MarR family transcriptional regulator [Parvibaculum sp.]|tara:strand:- start:105 stop:581 length:477 start_codon:yes stop_codon:yes gene_type:complete
MNKNQNPDRSTGFLLRDNSRFMKVAFNDRVSGLTQAQWGALAQLSRHEGLNQVGLADLLEVQPITVARMIDKLVSLGVVERRPDPNDRRAQQLFLTEKAQPLLDQMWEAGDEILDEAYAGFSDEERTAFIDMLVRMRSNLARLAQGGPRSRNVFRKAS